MKKVIKVVLIALDLLIGLAILLDFLALIFVPQFVFAFLLNNLMVALGVSTVFTVGLIFYYSRNEKKKVDSAKIINGIIASVPLFLIVVPLIIFLLLLAVGKIMKSEVAADVTGLVWPSYYLTLLALPQLILVGYILPEKIKVAVVNFFSRIKFPLTILAYVIDLVGFGFLLSLGFYPNFKYNALFSTLILPLYFLALVVALVVVLLRMRSLKKISGKDYWPFVPLIIVIGAFLDPNLLGYSSVTFYAFVFYLVPVIIIIINTILDRGFTKPSFKKKEAPKKK